MRILYCSYSQIPSNTANSIAVMKQCEALNHITELRVILVKGVKAKKDDVFSVYGVGKFPLILLPNWMLRYKELGLKAFVVMHVHRK